MEAHGLPLEISRISVTAIVVFGGVVGLFVGSFLNVVVYRTPLGLSVSHPRSFCPRCKRQLTWWENIPLLSWMILRGRCHGCGDRISIRYPAIELVTGASFAFVVWAWRGNGVSAGYCCLAAAMIAVSLVEYGGRRSPLVIAAVGTALGLLLIVVASLWGHHWHVLIGSLVGSGAAILVFALLRLNDPDCADPRGYGRSALLMAGCWIGGLGSLAIVTGASVWIVVYFACMVLAWSTSRSLAVGNDPTGSTTARQSSTNPAFAAPLVTSLFAAMAVSLLISH
jgi:leader peptidase (prepilin peptidase) / N-methyltransferase